MSVHFNIVSFTLLIICTTANAEETKYQCPVEFRLVYAKNSTDDPICYRLKSPELFDDKYKDCTGNLFSLTLYQSLNFTESFDETIWADYKSLYPGSIVVDQSYTQSTGKTLLDIKYNTSLGLEEELCAVIDPVIDDLAVKEPVTNFTSVRCNETYYRFCFVKPFTNEKYWYGCNSTDFERFHSPWSTCMIKIKQNVNWSSGQQYCLKNEIGHLLNKGWRYAKYYRIAPANLAIPLGIIRNSNGFQYYSKIKNETIPISEWYFKNLTRYNKKSIAALENDEWVMKNGSDLFEDLICEIPIPLKKVHFKLTVRNNSLILNTTQSVSERNIYCFNDILTAYEYNITSIPVKINVNDTRYILGTTDSGYYWCIHVDSLNHTVSESNRVLFIRDKQSLVHKYAIKLYYKKQYDLKTLHQTLEVWKNCLEEYIFYGAKYVNISEELKSANPVSGEDIHYGSTIRSVSGAPCTPRTRHSHPEDRGSILELNIKRLYLDSKTALVHVLLSQEMTGVVPGELGDLEIVYVKPVYYCKGSGNLPVTPLGSSFKSCASCLNRTCVGNFNEGVQWDTELPDLQKTLRKMQNKLNDSTAQVTLGDMETTLNEVNDVLEIDKSIENSDELLISLDKLGARVNLKSNKAIIVQSNIALLMADSKPEAPVRGFKIAAKETNEQEFNKTAFQIFSEKVNNTQLLSSNSEIVVQLPESIAMASRRISFVVFRNDKAFHSNISNQSTFVVNSRIVSVNVENTTTFLEGEVMEIHLQPLHEETKNQSRACAFWHFLEDGGGVWSQDGCVHIKTDEAMLDTCRCTHLTHFSEVLIPRTDFSRSNESVLEMLTKIGCIVSILGLFIVALTAALSKSWRKDFQNIIRLQLCIAIFVLDTCFLVIVFAKFDDGYGVSCILTGILLHFAVLSSFCWMLVSSILAYYKLLKVFVAYPQHRLLKASIFSWGAPCVVIGVLLAINPHAYESSFVKKSPNGAFCYPSGLALWLAVYLPIGLMVLSNWTLFVLIVRSVYGPKEIKAYRETNQRNEVLRKASVSCLLVFLFGLPWVFGLFAFNVVAAYFFSVTTSFQGFVLFLLLVLVCKNARGWWLKKLKMK